MWAGQCYTILMAFQLIFTRMVEMGLVERMADGGCFGDLWDKINSFVQEGPDYSYLPSLDEWLYIFVVACLKEDLIGGRKKLFQYL